MDISVIAEAFVVTVVGGLGCVTGAFLAALLIGLLQAFGILIFPKITLVLVFLLMALVLVVRPWGLMGEAVGSAARGAAARDPLLSPATREVKMLGAAALAGAAGGAAAARRLRHQPADRGADPALFAASLHFLIGPGGLASFGHAAYFGLGAYGAALAAKWLAAPMVPALLAAPLVAGIGGVAVRLLLRAAVGHLSRHADAGLRADRLGGRVPVGGADRRRQRRGRRVAVALGGRARGLLLPRAGILLHGGRAGAARESSIAPFGYTLRAGRDSPVRADAIGIDVRASLGGVHRRGGAAGLAGGLFAFSKGSVFPT